MKAASAAFEGAQEPNVINTASANARKQRILTEIPCRNAKKLYILEIYMPLDFQRITGSDWDDGNQRKSAEKHGVGQAEAESIFFNDPLIIADDTKHSTDEKRFNALGTTSHGRLLHLSFTLRSDRTLIRVISARDMNRKERTIYEQT